MQHSLCGRLREIRKAEYEIAAKIRPASLRRLELLEAFAAAKTAHAMALVVAGATATTDDDDFETLQRVEASLCEKLRRDEARGFDLGDQLSKNWTWRSAASAQPGKGAHEYFAEDPGSPSLIARGFARWRVKI